jgi:hypothetical protein
MKDGLNKSVGHVFSDKTVNCSQFLLVFVKLDFVWMLTQFKIAIIEHCYPNKILRTLIIAIITPHHEIYRLFWFWVNQHRIMVNQWLLFKEVYIAQF